MSVTVTIDTLQHLTTLAVGFLSSLGSAVLLGLWIARQLRKVEKIAEESLDKHEVLDQKRHEENLQRFTDIAVALARMGNGGFSDRRPL